MRRNASLLLSAIACASASACTLLFPLGDHELASGSDGSVDAFAEVGAADAPDADADAGSDAPVSFDPAELVVTLPVGSTHIALAPGLVYVGAPEGIVLRVTLATHAVEPLNNKPDPSQPITVTGLESDAVDLFVGMTQTNIGCGAAGYVYRRDHGDGGFTKLHTECGQTTAIAMDVADVSAVFTSRNVVLFPKPGGAIPLATLTDDPSALAATNEELFVGSASARSLIRVTKSGDAGVPFATNAGTVRDAVADATHVYWLAGDGSLNAKSRTANAADAPAVLASGQTAPLHLTQDAARLYWTASGDGAVRAIEKAGGAIVTLALGENDPYDVAVDDKYVYWTTRAGGALRRAAKH